MKVQIKYKTSKGNINTFYSEPNILSNDQMYWSENSPAMYASTKREVNRIIKFIRSNHTILEENIT